MVAAWQEIACVDNFLLLTVYLGSFLTKDNYAGFQPKQCKDLQPQCREISSRGKSKAGHRQTIRHCSNGTLIQTFSFFVSM